MAELAIKPPLMHVGELRAELQDQPANGLILVHWVLDGHDHKAFLQRRDLYVSDSKSGRRLIHFEVTFDE